MNIAGLLGAGGISGLFMGLVGVGGGALMTPMLLMSGLSLYQAMCIVLFIQVMPETLPALWVYYKKGDFPYKEGLVVLLGGAVGALIGAYLSAHKIVPTAVLYKIMSVTLIALGVYIWHAYV